MRKSRIPLVVLAAPFLLTACGDGWEAQRTTEITPYGGKRTAGSGVVYVRAKMLPEKELVVEPAPQQPVEMKKADEIFTQAQSKGSHEPVVRKSEKPAPVKKEKQAEFKTIVEEKIASDAVSAPAKDVSAQKAVPEAVTNTTTKVENAALAAEAKAVAGGESVQSDITPKPAANAAVAATKVDVPAKAATATALETVSKPVVSKPAAVVAPAKAETAVKSDVAKDAEQAKSTASVTPAAGAAAAKTPATTPSAAKSPAATAKPVEKKADDANKVAPTYKSYEQMLDDAASPANVEPKAGGDVRDMYPGKQSNAVGAPPVSTLGYDEVQVDIISVPEEESSSTVGKETRKSVIPVSKISSPVMDVYERDAEAEKSLDEIYSNPF